MLFIFASRLSFFPSNILSDPIYDPNFFRHFLFLFPFPISPSVLLPIASPGSSHSFISTYSQPHQTLSTALASKSFPPHFIVDQSRSGNGGKGLTCNLKTAAIGLRPSTTTPDAAIDAIVWANRVGESDGVEAGRTSGWVYILLLRFERFWEFGLLIGFYLILGIRSLILRLRESGSRFVSPETFFS